MKNSLKISLLVLSATGIAFLSTCKKETTDDNNDNPTVEWVTGTKTTVAIDAAPGEEVTETVNGLTFMFPDGGSGTLEVAPIISGAAPLLAGSGYYINFTGTDRIRLILPESDTATSMVWGYGEEGGLMQDYSNYQNTWVAIPYDSINPAKRSYLLELPQQKAGGKGYKYMHITLLNKESIMYDKYEEMKAELQGMINRYIDSLAAGDLKDSVKKRMWRLWYKLYWAPGPSYDPFWEDKSVPYCKIVMNPDFQSIEQLKVDLAHESGHYMMHLMVDNDAFKVMQAQLPANTTNHGIGTPADRNDYYIEESAYLSEYFQNGTVAGLNPEEPRIMLHASYNMPDVQDFPGIEGYGVVLFAGLHRTNPKIKDVHAPYGVNNFVDFPVIGAPFKDIFEIQGKGAKSIDELRNHINDYLISKNKGQLAVPFFQRLGWGYHNVTMTIVDPQGNKLSNVSARSICIVDGKTWYGPKMTTVTGADGKYTLKGVFGGNTNENGAINKIRFYRGTTDSVDVLSPGITNWGFPTNFKWDWGNIEVDLDNPLPPYLGNKDYGITVGAFTFGCPGVGTTNNYIPMGMWYGGPEDNYIICQSNGAGSITIDYSIWDAVSGIKETCEGTGTVTPHHIDPGFMGQYYYTFDITFTYKRYYYDVLDYQFEGTVTGVDHLDPYMTSDAVCTGTITRYWVDENQQPQSCFYTETFPNFILHDFIYK